MRFEGGEAVGKRAERNAGTEAVAEFIHVRNDANHFAVCLHGVQAVEHLIKGFVIEGAETFIEEERIDGGIGGHFCEPEPESEADEEGFSTGEVVTAARLRSTEQVVVNIEFQTGFSVFGFTTHQEETVCELAELNIGVLDEGLEGELLRKLLKAFFCAAEHIFELLPVTELLIKSGDLQILFVALTDVFLVAAEFYGQSFRSGSVGVNFLGFALQELV